MVGAERQKVRELSERLWRGTVSSLVEEERMVRGGRGCNCREDLQDMEGRSDPSTLNVIVESLKLIRELCYRFQHLICLAI